MKTVELFSFKLGDTDDYEITTPLIVEDKIKTTPEGKWALNNNCEISYHLDARQYDYYHMRVCVTTELTDKQATEFYLKYD